MKLIETLIDTLIQVGWLININVIYNNPVQFITTHHFVNRSQDLINFSDLGLIFQEYKGIEIWNLFVDRLAHHFSFASMHEFSHGNNLIWRSKVVVVAKASSASSSSSSVISVSSSTVVVVVEASTTSSET